MAFESKEMAAFNLAMPYLNRVNSILNSNYTEFKNGNIRAFAINLRQLYRELSPWLVINKTKNIDEKKPFEDAFKKLAQTSKKNSEEIWVQMEAIENMMRDEFKALGMLMPKVTDSRYLFGNSKQK